MLFFLPVDLPSGRNYQEHLQRTKELKNSREFLSPLFFFFKEMIYMIFITKSNLFS
jgi:hypothetical protein